MVHKKRKRIKRIKGSDLPTDKEIAKGIEEIAKWWLTTPGVPIGMTPQSPLWAPLFGSQTTSVVEGVPLTQTPAVMPGTVFPEFLRQAIADLQFPGRPPRKPRVRSPKQKVNDKIQSVALTAVNKIARKKDGSFKKGWSQKKVMRLAQKECTKERERLGLCKPKKSTRKGQRRKTARRAYRK